MRTVRQICLLLLVSVCALTVQLLAQSGRKAASPPGDPIVRIATLEVLVPVNAYDAEGHNVVDLSPQDVIVVEDGEPRTVTSLRHEPASILLILDLSNEIGTFKNGASQRYFPRDEKPDLNRQNPVWVRKYEIVPRPAAREFADNFIKGLSEGDEIAIIQYSDRVQLIQDWTKDRTKALDSMASKYRVGLKAKYYDALAMASTKLRERSGRRVVVLLSDGLDSASRTTQQRALRAIESVGASVFVVGWEDILEFEIKSAINWMNAHEKQGTATGKRMLELRRFLQELEGPSYELRHLADTTGGEMVVPANFDQLVANVPRDLHRELGAQYHLAFVTERRPGLDPERTIEVLPARPGLSVRSRRTYHVGEDSRK